MKTEPATEYENFKILLGKLIAVPHSVIVEREAAYQEQAALNPNRRGPKPKRKPASRASKASRS